MGRNLPTFKPLNTHNAKAKHWHQKLSLCKRIAPVFCNIRNKPPQKSLRSSEKIRKFKNNISNNNNKTVVSAFYFHKYPLEFFFFKYKMLLSFCQYLRAVFGNNQCVFKMRGIGAVFCGPCPAVAQQF